MAVKRGNTLIISDKNGYEECGGDGNITLHTYRAIKHHDSSSLPLEV